MRTSSTSVKISIALMVAVAGYVVLPPVARWFAANWLSIVVILAVTTALGVGAYSFRRRQTAVVRDEYAELSRHLDHADSMDIPQFEAWVGQLLVRDGFRKIRFVGRAGDFGSNFVATAPDRRRVVVRAKLDDRTLGKRGARHIQALGADAHAKWQADTAMLVTNADMHPLKTSARHDALAEQLGVILIDRWELAAWVADKQPPAELMAVPANPQ